MSRPSLDFLSLHRPGDPLLLANVWSAGTAQLMEGLGFEAVATTSAGYARTLGREDYQLHVDEALAHAEAVVLATSRPVSADLEDGFGDDPATVADTITRAVKVGLAGASIEDYTRRPDDPIHGFDHAVARVKAAVEAASDGLVITARAENHLHGRSDLEDTIARLQAFAEVGAHVVYAPGLRDLRDIARVVEAVPAPVNVLALPGGPSVRELASVGVARISVGSGWYSAMMRHLRDVASGWQSGASA